MYSPLTGGNPGPTDEVVVARLDLDQAARRARCDIAAVERILAGEFFRRPVGEFPICECHRFLAPEVPLKVERRSCLRFTLSGDRHRV